MQTKVLYLTDLKFNLETWKRELRFHFNEMDTFQEKLEEIAEREHGPDALVPLEAFQNRIMLEKSAISKLLHRIRSKMSNLHKTNLNDTQNGRLQNEHYPLKEDMRTYIKLHYEFKEEIMEYFSKWL
ncbi:MAG: hypothetical protein KDC97_04615 [Confluentibacter sp.]|nr:hypothetical protein [Confluentibacter sp.]